MSAAVELKHERIAAVLATEIRAGRVERGSRLPGETVLARRFAVSRNTVRSALAELSDAGLIATRTGKGSYVCFDGQVLDGHLGWARALAEHGAAVAVRVLGISARTDPALAARLGLVEDRFIVVRRVRELSDATAVSYERSLLPCLPELSHLPLDGLVDDSLTLTLARAGLYGAHGTQQVRRQAALRPGRAHPAPAEG